MQGSDANRCLDLDDLNEHIHSLQKKVLETKAKRKELEINNRQLETRIKVLKNAGTSNVSLIKEIASGRKIKSKRDIQNWESEKRRKALEEEQIQLEIKRLSILKQKQQMAEKKQELQNQQCKKAQENANLIREQRIFLETTKTAQKNISLVHKKTFYSYKKVERKAIKDIEEQEKYQKREGFLKNLEKEFESEVRLTSYLEKDFENQKRVVTEETFHHKSRTAKRSRDFDKLHEENLVHSYENTDILSFGSSKMVDH